MKPIRLPQQSPEQIAALEEVYHKTKDVRLQRRAQMILLAAEKQLVAHEIAEIVRDNEQTVRRWMKRYIAEGIEGLQDAPRPGARRKVTPEYERELLRVVRLRPRSMDLEFSMWTLQRLADYLAEATGIRVEAETVRQHLAKHDIVLSRPQHNISSPDPEYEVKKRRTKRNGTT